MVALEQELGLGTRTGQVGLQRGQRLQQGRWDVLGVMGMFTILIVVMVSQVYPGVKPFQTVLETCAVNYMTVITR